MVYPVTLNHMRRPYYAGQPLDPTQEPSEKKQKAPPPDQTGEWLGRAVIIIAAAAVAVAAIVFLWELAVYISEKVKDKLFKPDFEKLEQRIKEQGLGHLLEKVKQIKAIDAGRLIKRMALCNRHEQQVLKDLQERFQFSEEQLKEMLMGGHVFLDDKGKTYDIWSKMEDIKGRASSHRSDKQQFSIHGPFFKELLFSVIKDDKSGKTYTWFQLENHPVSLGHIVRHMIDYVKYKISSANQGPYGSSRATDKCPMCIQEKTAAAPVA